MNLCRWCDVAPVATICSGVGLCDGCKPKPKMRIITVAIKPIRLAKLKTPTRQTVRPSRVTPRTKFCRVCGKGLYTGNASGYCYAHRVKLSHERPLCACGCGARTISAYAYLAGHGPTKQAANVRRVTPRFCACGCGQRLTARWSYIKNHDFHGPRVGTR